MYVAVIAAYLTLLIVIIPFRLPLRLVGVKHGLGKSLFGIKAVHWTFYRWWKYGAIYWWTNPIDPKGRIYHLSNIQVRIIFFYNRLIFHSIKRILYDIWHILFVILETDYLSSRKKLFRNDHKVSLCKIPDGTKFVKNGSNWVLYYSRLVSICTIFML